MKEPVLYKVVRPIIIFLFKTIYRVEIVNKENIPKSGRVVVAGNHKHNFDCLCLMSSTKRCVHFLAKKELYSGIKKIIFNNIGTIAVDRSKKDPTVLKNAYKVLEDDKVIGIFPEGTFNKTKEIVAPFKIGAVKMASVTNSPIVPFAIVGDYKLFKKKLKVIYGKPYYLKSNDLDKENKILMRKVSDLLEEKR